MPTPAVAHLTKSMGAACGIMITASHNPACDNGIKIFAADGFKLPDDVELEIEKHILDPELRERHVPCDPGSARPTGSTTPAAATSNLRKVRSGT